MIQFSTSLRNIDAMEELTNSTKFMWFLNVNQVSPQTWRQGQDEMYLEGLVQGWGNSIANALK